MNNDEQQTTLLSSLGAGTRAVLPYVIGLITIPVAYAAYENFTHRNISFIELLFSNIKSIQNYYPYAKWSVEGEIGLILLNPGFISGACVGLFRVRSWKEVKRGLIPMGIFLTLSSPAILYWRAFHWIPQFLIPAFLGTLAGWWFGTRLTNGLTGRRLGAE